MSNYVNYLVNLTKPRPIYNVLQFTSLTLGRMLCGLDNINVDAMIRVTLEEDENNVLILNIWRTSV